MKHAEQRIQHWLDFIYGHAEAERLWARLSKRLAEFAPRTTRPQLAPLPLHRLLTEKDVILITYGDQFQKPPQPHLQTLAEFLQRHVSDVIDGVHILPFFPYSSDDGFSVIDYKRVDPALGDWDDILALKRRGYRLMFDAVINHVSRQSEWFRRFMRGEAPWWDYFIRVDPDADLSRVVRPRTSPLLTRVETARGPQYVWTTFGPDQIDLNYANPDVLLDIIDVLLFYVERGADIIRLDAIAYLWKEIGTSCIHLPQTHAMVKLWRAILDAVAPNVLIITETNVPHEENIRYFGEYLPEIGKTDEAQLVYNFTLAPLTLHAFASADARKLARWAASLQTPVGATFFNFIASHDGIGIRPAEGILDPSEMDALVQRTLAHGGQVSYKADPDGGKSVYELNITLYDFLNDPRHPSPENDAARFLASQAILLSLAGAPGVYVHSLFGSRNCHSCYQETGRARSLNRRKFALAELEAMLADDQAHYGRVFRGYREMLRIRRMHKAFHPFAGQRVLHLHPAVFSLLRTAQDGEEIVLCLINVSDADQTFSLPEFGSRTWLDLLTGERVAASDIALGGYEVRWLLHIEP